MQATILVDGVECHYRGRLSDFFSGAMSCPDRPEAPQAMGEIAAVPAVNSIT